MVYRKVDVRSDSVTKPNEAMRIAMASARVDDDQLGQDPTCKILQDKMAKMLGKEAALFVPSGTMGNLLCILLHCEHRWSEIILGDKSHIFVNEKGNIATVGGVTPSIIENKEDGSMDLDLIEAAIRNPNDQLFEPTTKLICLENSHTICEGRCLTVEYTDKVGELAKKYNLKLHIDGARLFNASIALDVPVDRLVQAADSVMVNLSKGLGAPAGAIIAGPKGFIEEARNLRKALGGGMSQEGVLAAPALVGIEENIRKLADDHRRAVMLAEEVSRIKGLRVNVAAVETNIVFVDIKDPKTKGEEVLEKLKQLGVLAMTEGDQRIRVCLHYQISDSDVKYIIQCFQQIMSEIKPPKPSKPVERIILLLIISVIILFGSILASKSMKKDFPIIGI